LGIAPRFLPFGMCPSPAQVAAVARSFGLTRAEAKLLDRLVFGRPAAAVARELGISPTTVKTHLAHIFGKTGVTRQSDLIRLVLTMAPPIAVCGKPD
jgi:DNA-binding CsgD family transcriptional regulator